MKTQTSRRFLHRLAARRLARILSVATVGACSLFAGQSVRALSYTYQGGTTGLWSTPGSWNPSGVPGSGDIAAFTGSASQTVFLNGNQAALGLSFGASGGTSAVRGNSATAQILQLGTGGIQFGSAQTDLGGTAGSNAIVMSLMGSQSWTGTSGGSLIQLNAGAVTAQQTLTNTTQQSVTNGTAGAITLTFDGVSTGGKTIGGVIDDGVLGGTLALTLNTTGTFGSLNLNGVNTYSGGTTFTQGFLNLQNNVALGTGALTFATGAQTKSISSGLVGGVTLTNNNALNLNGTITLTGSQNIDFGTGATTLQSATILSFGGVANPVNYTFGGAITGTFGLTIQSSSNSIANAILNLNGANTGNSAAAPITINGTSPTVRFGNNSAVPTGTGAVVLNGGAIAVGSTTAFAGATPIATFLADTRVTKTSGSIALTGDSSENFTAPNAGITLGAIVGTVVRYTGTITPSGTNYNLGGGGGTIVFSNANTFNGARTLSTNTGFNGGAGNSAFGAGGTTIITGQNTFNGSVSIGAGTLEVSSINRVTGGTATSNLGAPTSAGNGQINLGYSGQAFSELRYTGLGETTDRVINFNGFSGASIGLDASGSGAVTFGGAYTTANNSTNRFLSLRGINTGANTITAGIGTQVTNSGGINLTKQQRGNWTVSGLNNFAGQNNVIVINGGTLTADYTTNASNVLGVAANVTGLTLGGGTLAVVGNAAGGTTQTLGTTILTASTGQSNINVAGNGTAGSSVLTLGATFTRNANTFLNFNLTNGGQVATATTAVTNGVLVGTGTPAAAFTVTDGAGSDFATVTGGQIARLAATTPLPASASVSTTNYMLAGSQTLTASESAYTVRIDTSGGGGTLTLGANNLTLGGGTLLMSGSNAYNISGTRLAPAGGSITLANYGSGTLTVAAAVTDGGGAVTKTGPGLVDVTAAQAYTGTTNIYGGVLRLSNATFGTGNIALNTGGILEIGADLNGATAGDFSRQIGTGGSQIQWANGDGGFSAAGGNRAVSLINNVGVANGQLVWGSTSGNNNVTVPNASPAFVRDGQALLLSSSTATGTLDFQNPIDFVNVPRAVVVGDGTASVDAILSGVLSSSDYSGGLEKSGAGTLAVTAANTYTGETRILAGTLQIGNGGTTGSLSTNSAIINNGTLAFNRTNTLTQGTDFAGIISGTGAVVHAGTGTTILTGNNTYTGPTSVNAGTLLINNVPVGGVGSGTGTGAVSVNNGGTLGGTGAISGATTVNAGGAITGGTLGSGNVIVAGNVGMLSTGALTMANTSVFNVDIASASNYDVLNVTGTVTLSSSTFSLNIPTGLTIADGTMFVLINNDGADAITGTFAGVAEGGTVSANGYSFTASYLGGTGNDFSLTSMTAVPEPSTWVGAGLMIVVAVWSQRKRIGSSLRPAGVRGTKADA